MTSTTKRRDVHPNLLALWSNQSQALASKLSMWGPRNAGVASKKAIFKLVRSEFRGIL